MPVQIKKTVIGFWLFHSLMSTNKFTLYYYLMSQYKLLILKQFEL
jgi:hypothetical protein